MNRDLQEIIRRMNRADGHIQLAQVIAKDVLSGYMNAVVGATIVHQELELAVKQLQALHDSVACEQT